MFEHHSDRLDHHGSETRAKVVVFGSYHSGKTSLIRAIDPRARLTEAPEKDGTTTVALDLGVREHRGMRIFFYGTPGQERFGVARDVIAFGLHMGLVVSDATRGMTAFEKHLLSELKAHGVPCIVLASKMDLPGASLDRVRNEAGNDALVMPVSAGTGQGIGALLDRVADIAHRL
ncbi:MAG: elongation factor G [Methanocella sp. PtaU1.Bin125]|nr:MAG: elongation factor G [Methanocella sp. PtaU1.Bin125]